MQMSQIYDAASKFASTNQNEKNCFLEHKPGNSFYFDFAVLGMKNDFWKLFLWNF